MAISGLRHTENFVEDERPKNWRAGILMSYPNGEAPLTALTAAMKSESTDDPEFYWWEKEMQDRRLELSAAITDSATTLAVVGNAFSVKAGDLLRSEQTGEVMLVAETPTSNTSVVVVRSYAGPDAAAIADESGVNPMLVVIGSAYEEGSDAPDPVGFDPYKQRNFTQIFRNTLEMTRTARKTRLRTGDQVKEAKRECLEIHSVDMERGFWFGEKSEKTRNGKPVRTTGGILSWIPAAHQRQVNTEYPDGVTLDALDEYMYEIFRYGSSEKMMFLGNRALLTLNQLVRKHSDYSIQTGLKEYGINVSRLICPFGELVMKTHPLFNQMRAARGAPGFESSAVVLDMGDIVYRYIDDTQYEQNLQANGVDGEKSGYLTEAGMELHHARHHYVLKGLIKAADPEPLVVVQQEPTAP